MKIVEPKEQVYRNYHSLDINGPNRFDSSHIRQLSYGPTAVTASIFFSVGTFIPPGQCCLGAYLALISVDDGAPRGEQGLGCGGQTSQFTGTLITVSCFGRLALTSGLHSVTLVLFIGGGGPFVVEAGPSTAVLIQFD